MHWYYGNGGGWLGGLFMVLTMALLWGGLITVTVILVRRFAAPHRGHDEALRILNERYARGEIDKEEFEERRQNLLR